MVERWSPKPNVEGSSPSGRVLEKEESMSSTNKDQISLKDNMLNYFKGVKAEWGKITWPPKQQVIAETIYVIVIVFVFTMLVLLLDLVFKGLFSIVKDPSILTHTITK